MPRTRWLLPILPLLGGLLAAGCGGGGTVVAAFPGPAEGAVPFAPGAGQVFTIDLKNVAADDAPVVLTAYDPAGFVVPGFGGTVIVPADGEIRVNVAGVVPDGWIHVETRDPATLADLPTTRAVLPSFRTERSGPAVEAAPASPFSPELLDTGYAIPITEATQSVQVINGTRNAAVPTVFDPLTATFTLYETDGTLFSSTGAILAPNEGFFPTIPAGFIGSLVVTAVDDPTKFEAVAIASREQPSTESLGYDVARPVTPFQQQVFGVAYGQEASGNFLDFAIVVTNGRDEASSFTIDAIRTEGGGDVLGPPRLVVLGAHETRYYATTVVDSRGLGSGEIHPFADLFGDVFLASAVSRQWWQVSLGEGIHLCARNFEPAFFEAWMVIHPVPVTHVSMAEVIEQETSTFSGERNWITLVNPANAPLTVFVRSFTPGGNVLDLPDLVVPALGRLDWSPDGIVENGLLGIRENQNDPTSTPVSSFSLQFSSAGSFGLQGQREFRDGSGLILGLMPIVTRSLE
jgi:hypothetical protein